MKHTPGETTESPKPYTEDKNAGTEIQGENTLVPATDADNVFPDLDAYIKTIHKTILD